MNQIIQVVSYVHSNNIILRDLKPENILISKKSKKTYHQIKIIDFETATVFSKNKREHALIGSSYYITPEVISKKK